MTVCMHVASLPSPDSWMRLAQWGPGPNADRRSAARLGRLAPRGQVRDVGPRIDSRGGGPGPNADRRSAARLRGLGPRIDSRSGGPGPNADRRSAAHLQGLGPRIDSRGGGPEPNADRRAAARARQSQTRMTASPTSSAATSVRSRAPRRRQGYLPVPDATMGRFASPRAQASMDLNVLWIARVHPPPEPPQAAHRAPDATLHEADDRL